MVNQVTPKTDLKRELLFIILAYVFHKVFLSHSAFHAEPLFLQWSFAGWAGSTGQKAA
jgi:hypothetical protein